MGNRLVILTLLSAGLMATGQAQAKTICPAQIKHSVQNAYPDTRIYSCKKEIRSGASLYNLEIGLPDSARFRVDTKPDGQLVQTIEKPAVSGIPKKVDKAFRAQYPKAKLQSIEKRTRAADGKVFYDFKIKDKGIKKTVIVTDNGKVI